MSFWIFYRLTCSIETLLSKSSSPKLSTFSFLYELTSETDWSTELTTDYSSSTTWKSFYDCMTFPIITFDDLFFLGMFLIAWTSATLSWIFGTEIFSSFLLHPNSWTEFYFTAITAGFCCELDPWLWRFWLYSCSLINLLYCYGG